MRLSLRQAVPPHQPRQLCRRRRNCEDDSIEIRLSASLEEQWDVGNAEGMGSWIERREPSINRGANRWVNDGFEVAPGDRISEDDGAQGPAIQETVSVDDRRTEAGDDRSEAWSAWRGNIPGEHVGIHCRHPKLLQPGPNRALARSDAARQGDATNARLLIH